MGKHRLENNIKKLFKKRIEQEINYNMIRQSVSIYEDLNKGIELKSFNRKVLKYDLTRMKHNLSKLNKPTVLDLDNYFDDICIMAGYDPDIFKLFLEDYYQARW